MRRRLSIAGLLPSRRRRFRAFSWIEWRREGVFRTLPQKKLKIAVGGRRGLADRWGRLREKLRETDAVRSSREVVEAVLMDSASRTRLLGYALNRFEMRQEDAEDLLQETAVDLLRQRIHVRRPNGFVFSAFHLRCCRFVEIQKSRRQLLEKEWSPPADPAQAEKIENRVAFKQAMKAISVPCRRILRAYYVEGLSLQETARAIAGAYSGVWTRIDRCLKRLRQCLQ